MPSLNFLENEFFSAPMCPRLTLLPRASGYPFNWHLEANLPQKQFSEAVWGSIRGV